MLFLLSYIIIGFLVNLFGPLAKHLSIEQKHILTQNINKSWFYKYSLIFVLRILMTIIYPLFFVRYYILKRKPEKPVTIQDTLNSNVVRRFREIGKYNNTAPTEKTCDEKVIEIYQLICSSFKKASNERNERIPTDNLNTIAMKFFNVYEQFGEDFMKEHLEFELEKYRKEGLRPEYQKGISLF